MQFKQTCFILLCILAEQAFCLEFNSGKSKYIIDTNITITYSVVIPEGTTLIIRPGMRILFNGYYSLSIRGLIIAEGTQNDPIVFSAAGRPTGSRGRPQWKGIELIGRSAVGQFRHCRFEGAYRNLVWESSPSFDSCQFSGNHYALYCTRKAGPHISRCAFTGNVYGIAADYSFPLLLDNRVSDNAIGLYLQFCSEAIAGKNAIIGNKTNIKIECAFGAAPVSFDLKNLWDLIQQMY